MKKEPKITYHTLADQVYKVLLKQIKIVVIPKGLFVIGVVLLVWEILKVKLR